MDIRSANQFSQKFYPCFLIFYGINFLQHSLDTSRKRLKIFVVNCLSKFIIVNIYAIFPFQDSWDFV